MSLETQTGFVLGVLLWVAVPASGALALEPLSDGELDRVVALGLQNPAAEPDPESDTSSGNGEPGPLLREDLSESAAAGISADEDSQEVFTLIAESDLPPAVMSYITGTRNARPPTNRSIIRVRRRLPSLPMSLLRSRGFVLPLFIR